MKNTVAFAMLLLGSCAHTDLYDSNGKRIARFEGDMTGVSYHRSADGSVDLSGNISHSAATLAQGQAASGKLAATGTALAASGILTLLRP